MSFDQLIHDFRQAIPVGGWDNAAAARKVYLHAGQLHATDEPMEIVTIVGSSVSICMFDRARCIGGLNHFMLPAEILTVNARYARHAIDLLIAQLVALGARRARLDARVFGGASVLRGSMESSRDLGAQNVAAARAKLSSEQIPIVSEAVGGGRGRRITFSTIDGSVAVKEV